MRWVYCNTFWITETTKYLGTKHIDPNTGLIYFKYDFGYEFGIIFPGEGKKIIGGTRHITHDTSLNNNKPFHSSASDINIPVVHERTAAGNSINNGHSSPNEYLLHLNTNDPKRKRLSLPAQIDVDNLTRTTPDRMTPNYKRGIVDELCTMFGGRRMFCRCCPMMLLLYTLSLYYVVLTVV